MNIETKQPYTVFRNDYNQYTFVNVNTKMYKKGNLFMNKKRNEIVHLI